MSERMNELYTLTQRAQKMELINEEIALGIYLEIFASYTPKISKTYDSAIRLLEKRHRYQEALDICNKAIELIKEDQISGTIEKFETVQLRLERKMVDLNPQPEMPIKKPFKLNVKLTLGLLLLVLFGILLFRQVNPYDDINVNLEGKEALDGGDQFFETGKTEEDEMLYPITQKMIDIATSESKKFTEVNDVMILPQASTLGIAILVKPGTSEDKCQDIATDTLKALSGAAAAEYKDLKGPSLMTLGEIYDYYELVISVGIGVSEDEIIARGTKNKGSDAIYWRKN